MRERITCLYPGSFDPVTVGHLDIIQRAAALFDRVVVGVLVNPDKHGCFPVEKRMEMLQKACGGIPNVDVISWNGLLAELTKQRNIRIVVRGVRNSADLDSESAMAHINRRLNPHMDTLFLPASPEKAIVSASMVRQLASFHADISPYVPPEVLPDILAAFP